MKRGKKLTRINSKRKKLKYSVSANRDNPINASIVLIRNLFKISNTSLLISLLKIKESNAEEFILLMLHVIIVQLLLKSAISLKKRLQETQE